MAPPAPSTRSHGAAERSHKVTWNTIAKCLAGLLVFGMLSEIYHILRSIYIKPLSVGSDATYALRPDVVSSKVYTELQQELQERVNRSYLASDEGVGRERGSERANLAHSDATPADEVDLEKLVPTTRKLPPRLRGPHVRSLNEVRVLLFRLCRASRGEQGSLVET